MKLFTTVHSVVIGKKNVTGVFSVLGSPSSSAEAGTLNQPWTCSAVAGGQGRLGSHGAGSGRSHRPGAFLCALGVVAGELHFIFIFILL